MGKKTIMLKSFLKVIVSNKKQLNLMVPDYYVKDIYMIDYEHLLDKGFINLIFDIDNTILPVNDIKVNRRLIKLFKTLKKKGFKICLMSNNGNERVNPVSKKLKVLSLANADKPTKESFDNVLKLLQATKSSTIMIGDQMLSDIKGANEYGIASLLVEPLDNKYDLQTGTSRFLQNIIELKLKKKKRFIRHNYY
ncbi:MAG: YqeG family HAD IIIA-type phosphatase [Bacilli bacterium]|nr:YqeG family HAD IIIA-type phosphatase [Bacilli bacterium]MDD4809378.1 YqeG family HAD IIIA-type phosphatase [Bacilli bacterium]